MKKILILSDSHGKNKLLEEIIDKENPDVVIHCGDHCMSDEKYLNEKFNYYVRGNNDYIGEREIITNIDGINFLVIHGDEYNIYFNEFNQLAKYASDIGANIVLYGHTHVENYIKINDIILINPGSISLPRNKSNKKSYGIINIKNGQIVEKKLDEIVRYI